VHLLIQAEKNTGNTVSGPTPVLVVSQHSTEAQGVSLFLSQQITVFTKFMLDVVFLHVSVVLVTRLHVSCISLTASHNFQVLRLRCRFGAVFVGFATHSETARSVLNAAVCCLLSAVCCLLSAVSCLLSAVCCLLSAVCCLLSDVCCLLCAVSCLLSALCYLLPASYLRAYVSESVASASLFGGLPSVVCCLLSSA
jgi:hypothetical protein